MAEDPQVAPLVQPHGSQNSSSFAAFQNRLVKLVFLEKFPFDVFVAKGY